jgi:hypothetical protein
VAGAALAMSVDDRTKLVKKRRRIVKMRWAKETWKELNKGGKWELVDLYVKEAVSQRSGRCIVEADDFSTRPSPGSLSALIAIANMPFVSLRPIGIDGDGYDADENTA